MYDRVAEDLGPRLTDAAGSDAVAGAIEIADAVRDRVETEMQRSSRRFLHAWNLPTGSDIGLLRREIGALDRQVRALSRQVESLQAQLAERDGVDADVATAAGDKAPQR